MQTVQNGSTIKCEYTTQQIEILDSTDTTKKLDFDCSAIPTGTSVVLTAPSASTRLVGRDTVDTLTHKTLDANSSYVADTTDPTKRLAFTTVGLTTGQTVVLSPPNVVSDVIETINSTANVQNKTITHVSNTVRATQLGTTGADVVVSAAAPPTAGQVLTATAGTSATWQTPSGGGGSAPPFADNVAILKNSADNTKELIINVANVPTATTQTLATPAMNNSETIVVESATQTLNFKTLQNATITDTVTNNVAANLLGKNGSLASTATTINNLMSAVGQALISDSLTTCTWQPLVASGTYTPTFVNTGMTVTSTTALYVKIGRVVSVFASIVYSASSGGGAWLMTLPVQRDLNCMTAVGNIWDLGGIVPSTTNAVTFNMDFTQSGTANAVGVVFLPMNNRSTGAFVLLNNMFNAGGGTVTVNLMYVSAT